MSKKLNEAQEESISSLWKVSYPIMIFFLSMVAMQFVDRVFLARYSSDALSAVAGSGTLFWCPFFSWITLASRTEAFVAQYNGAKLYSKLGEPVWQMLYLSLFSIPFFLFLAWPIKSFLYKTHFINHLEAEYFQWSCFFAPFSVVLASVSGFYIGQKKTKIINWIGLFGNGVNVLLDPLLIFGWRQYIPPLGVRGAAIATGIGILTQVVIILFLYFRKINRIHYGVFPSKFIRPLFFRMISKGLPSAIALSSELLGWALFYWLMKKTSDLHIFAASLGQSCLQLFIFFGAGLEKGSSSIAGNLIGSQNFSEIKKLFKSGFLLCLAFFFIILSFRTHFMSEVVLALFKNHPSGINPESLKTLVCGILGSITIYLALENIRWHINGILNAAGDTFFVMIYGVLSVWVFLLLPGYFFIFRGKGSIMSSFYIWVAYSFSALLLALWRFFSEKWKEKRLIENLYAEKS